MKVLVTGSTGFIGAHLCRALAARGDEVRAFHRPTSRLTLLEDLPVEHFTGDLGQPETIRAAMQGVQVVFHAAAQLGGHEPGRMYTVTVEGTRAVMRAALEAGVERVVHTSSIAALGVPESGPAGGRLPALLSESHTWNYAPERWPYGYAKYLAELEVQSAVAAGLDAVIVNPSMVIGPGDIYRQTSSLVVQVARGRLPALVEGGANWVHVADVVDGHLAALARGRRGERYILGGENMTHTAVVAKMAAAAGVIAPILVLPGGVMRLLARLARPLQAFLSLPVELSLLNLAGKFFYCDPRKTQSELGLIRPRPVDEAVRAAYEWFVGVGAIRRRR